MSKPAGHLIVIGTDTLWVEVAITPEQRARGLMFRQSLARDSGMLFVFDQEQTQSFWMKNTPIDLSIAFLDENMVVVDTQDMEKLSTFVHRSRKPALYAIEANKGWFREKGIGPGDTAVIR